MSTTLWSPGEFITPGDLRAPRTIAPTVTTEPTNPDFELGNTGWALGPGFTIVNSSPFSGAWSLQFNTTSAIERATNNNVVPVVPGQTITASCQVQQGASSAFQAGANVALDWLDASNAVVLISKGNSVNNGSGGAWHPSSVTAVCPPGATKVRISCEAFRNSGGNALWADYFLWDYVQPVAAAGLVYKAVQANAGFTASIEPAWPLTLGLTVVDNEVTWEAVLASNVTWTAFPIMKSDTTEPTWPLEVGASVLDGTVIWRAVSRRVEDEKCPNTTVVIIGASKIFAGDRDIIKYSATINPLDWSTPNDAGYLPFGLQLYGSNPVSAMGLYRSNLVAFNSEGFQMWQIDQDPAAMAFLDAVPVGSTEHQALQPVANDLFLLNPVGVRNLAIAGASTNLQAEGVGEEIDPLVTVELAAGIRGLGLFWPAAGQYWVFFGAQAFVLTINAAKKRTWSRYVFPTTIDDWTLQGNDLYLRSGVKVWKVDASVTQDDVQPPLVPLLMAVCPSAGQAIMTSSNGTTWTLQNTPGSSWVDVAYSPTLLRFVAVGNDDCVMISNDNGATWAASSLTGNWQAVCWSAGLSLFTAVGNAGKIATSPDGLAWTSRTAPDSENYVSVKWIPSLSLLVAGKGNGTAPRAATSVNGVVWTNAVTSDYSITSVAMNGTTLVGAGNVVERSTDALNWVTIDSGVNTKRAAYGNGVFVAVGGTSVASRSTDDGLTWGAFSVSPATNMSSLCWSELLGVFVAATSNADPAKGVLTSQDGQSWAAQSTPPGALALNFNNVIATEVPNPAVGVDYSGVIWWNFLDLASLGGQKDLEAIDLVSTAPAGVTISIGWNQNDRAVRTTEYAMTADSLTGTPAPFPMSAPSYDLRLTFAANQAWEWFAANIYYL